MNQEQKAIVIRHLLDAAQSTITAVKLLESESLEDTKHWLESSRWWLNRAREEFDEATAGISAGDFPVGEPRARVDQAPKASSHSYHGLANRDAPREPVPESPPGRLLPGPSVDRESSERGRRGMPQADQ